MIYVRSVTDAGGYDANGNRYIIVDLLCDSDSDLPSVSYFISAECILFQGSTAEIISSGAKYEMQSDGTWTLKQAGQATYTKSEIDSLLADRMPLKNADYMPLVTSGTWDLWTLPIGVYYRTSSVSDVAHIPAGLNVAFFAIVQNTVGSNRRQITLYPCTQATAGEFYRCLETGSGYGAWYKFSGVQV